MVAALSSTTRDIGPNLPPGDSRKPSWPAPSPQESEKRWFALNGAYGPSSTALTGPPPKQARSKTIKVQTCLDIPTPSQRRTTEAPHPAHISPAKSKLNP